MSSHHLPTFQGMFVFYTANISQRIKRALISTITVGQYSTAVQFDNGPLDPLFIPSRRASNGPTLAQYTTNVRNDEPEGRVLFHDVRPSEAEISSGSSPEVGRIVALQSMCKVTFIIAYKTVSDYERGSRKLTSVANFRIHYASHSSPLILVLTRARTRYSCN